MNATLRSLARLGLVAAATGTVLFGTTACSLASVPADSVEQQIVSKLGAQGVSLDNGKADCATDLDATVGASRTCEFHSGGQPVGAVVGGFVIAFSEVMLTYAYKKFATYLVPENLEPSGLLQFLGTDYKFAISFIILVLVLLVRPTGIFKGKVL